MQEYNEEIENLWYLLLSYDKTWQYAEAEYGFVLVNNAGQMVQGNTERGVLKGAIVVSEPKES